MDEDRIVNSTQDQACGAFVAFLNQLRAEKLIDFLVKQDENLRVALETLALTKEQIAQLIALQRGGPTGLHGFISEVLQGGIGNARNAVAGEAAGSVVVDDNGAVDIIIDGIKVQMKFVQKNLGLNAIREHLEKYQDFLSQGGEYIIPEDFYIQLKRIVELSAEDAKKLPNTEYRIWKLWQEISQKYNISFDDIKPSVISYAQAQKDAVSQTVAQEDANIRAKDKELRDEARQKSKPSAKEAAGVILVSAFLEGGVEFALGVHRKVKSGKPLGSFTADDWKELGIDATKGGAKGAIRGGSVYAMTNYAAMPAPVATALMTATFGIAGQAQLLRTGAIRNDEFTDNCQIIALDVTVSALSAALGQTLIPIPVLGAIIGNLSGQFTYEIAKTYLSASEQALLKCNQTQIQDLDSKLDVEYHTIMTELESTFAQFTSLTELAFDPDINLAFKSSIHLGVHVGVTEDTLLKTTSEIDTYFLG